MKIKKSISIDDKVFEKIENLAINENSNPSAIIDNACVFFLDNLELYFKNKSKKYKND